MAPAEGATVSGVPPINGTIDTALVPNFSSVQVFFGSIFGPALVTGNTWSINLDSGGLPNGPTTIRAEARDIGNITRATDINNVTVNN